jgi:hypothetical protein
MSAPSPKRILKHNRPDGGAIATPRPQAPTVAESMEIEKPPVEEIARLAYSYWEARGCPEGSPEEDWLIAEQQLRASPSSGVDES